MTPTLGGRIQTRLFLAVTVGVMWTAIIVPFLPRPAGVTNYMEYRMDFATLLVMIIYGLVWEHLYHGLQQLRWDKDWPSIFVLLTGLNEGVLVWFLGHFFGVIPGPMGASAPGMTGMAGMMGMGQPATGGGGSAMMSTSTALSSPYLPGFVILFGTTWILMWLFSQGPMRVICVRWRFEGGRIAGFRLNDQTPPDGRPRTPGSDGNGGVAARPPGAPDPTGAALPVYAGSGRAQSQSQANGTQAVASEDLVEGITCGYGHFGYPGMRYCMVCGTSMLPMTGALRLGRRPPLGILILEDGATHVLAHDLRLARVEGTRKLAGGRRGDVPAASALVDIRLAGWQPVVSSEFYRIALEVPGGGHLDVAPGVPAPLMPGAEFTVERHRIRYESPYQPADLDPAAEGPRIRALPGNGAAAATPPSGRAVGPALPPKLAAPSRLTGPGDSPPARELKTYSIGPRRKS